MIYPPAVDLNKLPLVRDIKLLRGTVALMIFYVIGNVAYHYFSSQPVVDTTIIQAKLDRGQVIAESCAACHHLDERTHFVGPYLVGLIDRPIASAQGYDYSDALKKLPGNWSEEKLTAFLSNPQAVAPGTKMALEGWKSDDIGALIAYLESKK